MSGFMAVKRRLIYSESKFSTRKDWVLSIHAARIKLLLDASALSDGGWKLDTDKLSGNKPYIDPDDSKQTDAAIHDYEPKDGCAYGTFFKYEKEKTVRYYFLFTCWGMTATNVRYPDVSKFDVFPMYYANVKGSNTSSDQQYFEYPGTLGFSYGANPFNGTNPKDSSFIEFTGNSPIVPSANPMYISYSTYYSGQTRDYRTYFRNTIPMIPSDNYIDLIVAVRNTDIVNMFHYSQWSDLRFTCSIVGELIETQIADPSATTTSLSSGIFVYYKPLTPSTQTTNPTQTFELTQPTIASDSGSKYLAVNYTQTSLGEWVRADVFFFNGLTRVSEGASITPYTLPLVCSASDPLCPNGWLSKGFIGDSTLRSISNSLTSDNVRPVLDGDFISFAVWMLAWDKTNAERVGF